MEQPHVVVLFGATGDLAKRKLLPGLLRLFEAGLLRDARIVGTSLEDLDTEQFVKIAHQACEEPVGEVRWAAFAAMLTYVAQGQGPAALKGAVEAAEAALADLDLGEEIRRLHYLSVPPKAALDVIRQLDEAGLVDRARIIMEKPFGTDLESAKRLNALCGVEGGDRQLALGRGAVLPAHRQDAGCKRPGQGMKLEKLSMQFATHDTASRRCGTARAPSSRTRHRCAVIRPAVGARTQSTS